MPDSGSFLSLLKQDTYLMSRRTNVIAAALSVLALGSPFITACADQGRIYFEQGLEKFDSGNYQGAIVDYTKAIGIDPQSAAAYYNRGNAKNESKDYQGAIADYTKTIEIDPQFALAYMNRGIKRENQNDLEGACQDWRKAAELGRKEPAKWVKQQC